MDKVDITTFRLLGLIIGFFLLAGSASGQPIPDSSETMAFTESMDKTNISQASNPAITLNLEQVSLKKALKQIAGQAEAGLYYNTALLPEKTVSLHLQAVPLGKALRKVLKGTSLKVITSGRNITLRQKRETQPMQLPLVNMQETITGTVTDGQSGETLPGVNILVKGTNTGASTDSNGNFELTVESLQDTLVFSYIGYQTQEVPINGRTTIDIALQTQAVSGEEVVVVGYGEQEAENVTASISSVDSEELNSKPITNSTQALQGTKGVYVNQMGAQPGRSSARIRIRGQGTLNNNNPLVLVDGVEYSLENIDPENIESISVLKDAAASAIYGSRAANGVVLVTTKSGKGVDDFQASYSNYFGIQQVIGLPDFITDPVRWMELRNQAQRNAGRTNVDFSEDLIEEYSQGMETDPNTYPHNDWFDIMFDPAFLQNHNVRFSGGQETFNYSLAVGYQARDGVLMGTNSNNYSIDLNTSANITDRLTVSAKINGKIKKFNEPVAGVPYLMEFTFKNAGVGYEPTYTEDGRYADPFILTPGHYVFRNPIALASEGMNNHEQQNYLATLQAEYNFPSDITYEIKGSYTKYDYLNKIFEPALMQHFFCKSY